MQEMKGALTLIIAVVLLGVIANGCVSKPDQSLSVRQSAEQSVAPAGIARQAWEAEWEKVLEAGKKERTVSVYDQWLPEIHVVVGSKFKEKFGITVEFTTIGRAAEIATKLERERSAGLYLADAIGGGFGTIVTAMKPKGMIAPIEPMLILPEARDTRVRRAGKIYLDDEQKFAIALTAEVNTLLARNTDLVKEGEIKSFYDILNPKWRGMIVMNDPTAAGGGNVFVTLLGTLWGPDKTKDYLRELVKQEPVLSRDLRLQAEWLAKGKSALAIGTRPSEIRTFEQMGAPVARVRAKEGGVVTTGPGVLSMPAGQLPHPNAARVFINWLLTKEGQTLYSKAGMAPSMRLDVPVEGLEDSVPTAGDSFEDEATKKRQGEYTLIAREVLAPLFR